MSGLVPVCFVASSDFVSPVCPRRNPKGVHAKDFDRCIPASTRASGNRDKGSGEGETFLGEAAVTTDADGVGAFALTVDAPGAMPASFTATVTSSEGVTSEFSAPIALSE